jgi:hypothetical protein
MAKSSPRTPEAAAAALERATRQWREAKRSERAARDALAGLVRDVVSAGLLSENKVARLTEIPRMTIRKMLGKD